MSHALPVRRYTKKEEGKHSHDSWAKLARGISHTIENPAQNINWASYPHGVWHQSVGGKQFYCALVVYFFLLSLFATIAIFYITSIIKLFLSQHESFTFASPPLSIRVAGGEWQLCGCQLWLHQDAHWDSAAAHTCDTEAPLKHRLHLFHLSFPFWWLFKEL